MSRKIDGGKMKVSQKRTLRNPSHGSQLEKEKYFSDSLFHLAGRLNYLNSSLREKINKSTKPSRNRIDENAPLVQYLGLAEQCASDIVGILKVMRHPKPTNSSKRFKGHNSFLAIREPDGHWPSIDTGRLQLISEREREVMRLLVSNESNKQVAFDLRISVRTVEIHRRRIMEKLGLHSIGELVHLAIRNGIVEA